MQKKLKRKRRKEKVRRGKNKRRVVFIGDTREFLEGVAAVYAVKWPSNLENINQLLNLAGIIGDRIPW